MDKERKQIMKTHNPPWPYMFVSEHVTCMFCLQSDCPVLARRPESDGQAKMDEGRACDPHGEPQARPEGRVCDPHGPEGRACDPHGPEGRVCDSHGPEGRVEDPHGPEATVTGICEACVLHAHWVWRTSPGEAPPAISEDAVRKVARVKVVLARRRPMMPQVPGSQAGAAESSGSQAQKSATIESVTLGSVTPEQDARADPSLVSSYDFVMVAQEEGDVDFPGCDLADGMSEAEAVKKALEKISVCTWPSFVEPLYKAYTPRGRLVSVVLVTAWAMIRGDFKKSYWREWPSQQWVVPGMKGFYAGFENAWALRLHKRQSATQSTEEISVFVHEAAARYIDLQQQLRSGERPQDLPMLEYLRKSMTEDERKIDARLRKLAETAMDLKEQLAAGAAETDGGRGLDRGQVERIPAGEEPGVEDDEAAEEAEEKLGSREGDSPEPEDPNEPDDPDDDPADDNDWPDDLPIRPGDEVVEAEFEELSPEAPQPGFLRVGRPLDTSKK